MSLRINQNMGALNVHRNLLNTDATISKSLEKLASGFRINRGADDPAGLVISEYLRAQVEGLGQAISNSSDAINLVRTAEGALTEVNNLLKSMRNLAVHASNTGVNSAEALAADQAQIASAIESLNRIASTTMFGDKHLLDGTSGVSGTSTNSLIEVLGGNAATKAGTYAVDVTAVATQAYSIMTNSYQVQRIDGDVVGANSITGTDFGYLQFGGAYLDNQTVNIRVQSGDTIQDIVDRINSDTVVGQKVKAEIYNDPVNGNVIRLTTRFLENANGALTVKAVDGGGGTGTAANVAAFTGIDDSAAMTSTATVADRTAALAKSETLTLTDNIAGKSTQVMLAAGDSLEAIANKINNAALAAGVRLRADLVANTGIDCKMKLTSTEYGTNPYASVTIASTASGAGTTKDFGLGATTLTVQSGGGAAGNFGASVGGTNVAGTINGEAATGAGQILTGNAGNAYTEGLKLKVAVQNTGTAVALVTVQQGTLSFQIGGNAGQLVSQSLDSTAANRLGTSATGLETNARSVADIDVTTLKGAQDAIKIIDAAISQVSTMRAQLGAFQKNVLESNINSLGIAKENLQASESTIRDLDMAAEMVAFTRNNIMMQAGTAMLAQANQLPQQMLALLR